MNSIFDELRGAIYSVWHRRWLALAVAWAVCLLGWLVVAMIPNSYQSKARIYVQLDDPLVEQILRGLQLLHASLEVHELRSLLSELAQLCRERLVGRCSECACWRSSRTPARAT